MRRDAVEATRENILRATADLWLGRGYDEVTLDAVAEQAGVTRQTVIRHFGSKEELVVAVTRWYGPQIEAARDTEPGDLHTGLRRLVDEYEDMGDANVRMLELEERVEAIHEALDRGRAAHRRWIERLFAPHLSALGNPAREETVAALYAATDVTVWKLLRHDLGYPRGQTEAVIRQLVDGVLCALHTDRQGASA